MVRAVQAEEPVTLQAIGIDVLSAQPVPANKPMMAAYPVAFSLYLLPFDDPNVAGQFRFMAEKFYRVQAGKKSEELPYQPISLEGQETVIIDGRLCPRSPGLYRLRVFAIVSAGVTVKEHDLIPSVTILVPEPIYMDGGMVTPNFMM
jgi:hypothetical protein